jgi:uncharacterized membrane protein
MRRRTYLGHCLPVGVNLLVVAMNVYFLATSEQIGLKIFHGVLAMVHVALIVFMFKFAAADRRNLRQLDAELARLEAMTNDMRVMNDRFDQVEELPDRDF